MNTRVVREIAERPQGSVPLFYAIELTGTGGVAHIRLGDQVYTLRITRAGKLILTK